MTEKELHVLAMSIHNDLAKLINDAMGMSPTVELCIFVGKISAAFDALDTLVEAGPPVPAPGEGPHPLAKSGRLPAGFPFDVECPQCHVTPGAPCEERNGTYGTYCITHSQRYHRR